MLFVLASISFAFLFGATVLTSAGKAIVTNLVSGLGGVPAKWIGWGTGAGTAAVTDTDLFTASAEARTVGTVTRTTTTVTNDTVQVVGTITATGSRSITNVATFDALTSGNISIHADHSTISLATGEAIQYTITLQFT